MPDFPSELVEAIRDGKWTIEQEIATTIAHADGQTPIPDLAALIAARVVPLIQQAERDRLAKQAGEIKQFPASDCQIHENERCVEMPCCGFTFAADHLDHSDEDTYTCPVCSPMFACGAAAERERIESLPRYVAVTQEAWRPGDRPPIMHECVALADVRELPVRPSHPDAEAASTTPGGLNTDRSESAALSSPAEPDTEEGGDAQ